MFCRRSGGGSGTRFIDVHSHGEELDETQGYGSCTWSISRRSFGVRLAGLVDMSGTWRFCVDELGASEGVPDAFEGCHVMVLGKFLGEGA